VALCTPPATVALGDVSAQTGETLTRTFGDMNASHDVFGKDFPARATMGVGLMGADGPVETVFVAAT